VAAAQNLVRGLFASFWCAMGVGVLVCVGGAVGSFYTDTAPGALIVVLAIAVFMISWPASMLLRRGRLTMVAPEPLDDDDLASPHVTVIEGHPHRHGPDCGHVRVRHGDHDDFIHEGHRHAVHADHYDEH
jgi:zinc transport system permease protein